jgi:hypothetical protein
VTTQYLLDSGEGEPFAITLDEFVGANECLDESEVTAVRTLAPGQTYRGGGGAAAEWSITRTA